MANTHLRRLLDRFRRPDEEGDRQARPAPIDPAVIEARKGDVEELAGLSPSDRLDRATSEGRR